MEKNLTEVVVARLPECDVCGEPAEYDVKTKFRRGVWANLCEFHWPELRAYEELGTGKGQKLVVVYGPPMSEWGSCPSPETLEAEEEQYGAAAEIRSRTQ